MYLPISSIMKTKNKHGIITVFIILFTISICFNPAAAQNADCDDLAAIGDKYQRFIDYSKGTSQQKFAAIDIGYRFLQQYADCEDQDDVLKYVKAMVPRLFSGLTQTQAITLLNQSLAEIIGKFRTPSKELGSFYYTEASATTRAGNSVEINTRRSSFKNNPGAYDCQRYGVIESDQVFNPADIIEIKKEPTTNTENAGILLIVLRSEVGSSTARTWAYSSYNSSNGVCSGWKIFSNKTVQRNDIGIPYSRGQNLNEETQNYERLRAIIIRLVQLAQKN